MEKLNIDWLHKENKSGRRSGRTTEMLANAVGVALLSDKNTDIHIVCGTGNEVSMRHSFIWVLRSVSPTTTYFEGTHNSRPCVVLPAGENIIRVIFRNNSPVFEGMGNNGYFPVDETWFFDHYYDEMQEVRGSEIRGIRNKGYR